MQEVLDEVVQLLTEEKYKGKMSVIFAGYKPDLDALFDANPGLKSRMSTTIDFKAFSARDAAQLLRLQLSKKALRLDEDKDKESTTDTENYVEQEDEDFVLAGLRKLTEAPQWSSGRDVDTLGKMLFQAAAKAKSETVTKEIFDAALESCLNNKQRPEPGTKRPVLQLHPGIQTANPVVPAEAVQKTKSVTATVMKSPHEEIEEDFVCKEVEEVKNHFADIPKDFLQKVQGVLLANGVDIGDAGQVVGFDLETLEQGLRAKGLRQDVAHNLLQQWKTAMDKMLEQQRKIEEELAAKKRALVPRWRCAICGRPFCLCQVAPYVEGYDDVEV